MLYPSMSDLLKKVNNRYMLVNQTAKRARDIADEAEENHVSLSEKPVKIALNDIIAGRIVLRERQDDVCEEDGADGETAADFADETGETGETALETEPDVTTTSDEEVSEPQQN